MLLAHQFTDDGAVSLIVLPYQPINFRLIGSDCVLISLETGADSFSKISMCTIAGYFPACKHAAL